MSMNRMTDPYRGTDHPEFPPTLTEFLLARIAEDQAEARKWQEREARWPSHKVLAECGAKRQIVENYTKAETCALDETHDPEDLDVCAWRGQGLYEALIDLATVYADHPDYHEEWRP